MGDKLATGLLAVTLLNGCAAQQQQPTVEDGSPHSAFTAGTKARPDVATAEQLAAFESPSTSYLVGPGDELTIDVWGYPELSGAHVVGPDGRVTIPVIGSMVLAERSREDAAKDITEALASYYRDAAATVRIDRYVSNQVLVLGRVTNPGAIRFEVQPTLLDAITRAGGLPIGGVGADKAALTRCAVFRGRDRVLWVDLRSLLRGENLGANIALRSNDVVFIPDADDQLIYVMGEVNQPGAYQLTPDMSFLDLLAKAGGPTRDAAEGTIQVVRPTAGVNAEVNLEDLLQARAEFNFRLAEGDIVYVPQSGVAKVGYVLEKLSPITQMIMFSAALAL
jgi:polysaccharide export outer membrane protein